MTTVVQREVICGICGEGSNHYCIGSTNQFGSPDLDLRPPEMARSTMSYWLQNCPTCGFVAPDLAEAEDGVENVLTSHSYRTASSDPSTPELTRLFLCRSIIEHSLGRRRSAFSQSLAAAWVADDAGLTDLAATYRRQAAAFLRDERDLRAEERLRLVDVLRRAGEWDAAGRCADDLRSEDLDETLVTLVAYERRMIQQQDAECHSVQEALRQTRADDGQRPTSS